MRTASLLPLALVSLAASFASSCASSGTSSSTDDGTTAGTGGGIGAGGFHGVGGSSGRGGSAQPGGAGGSTTGVGGAVTTGGSGGSPVGGPGTGGAGTGGANVAGSSSGGAPLAACASCVSTAQCGNGSACVQIVSIGDSLCLPSCVTGGCTDGATCVSLSTTEGQPNDTCVPATNCGSPTTGGGGSPAGQGGGTGQGQGGAPSGMCGALASPDTAASCTSCMKFGKPCQTNGCYGGYWCNTSNGSCQPAPSPGTCPGGAGGGGQAGSSTGTGGSAGTGVGTGGAPTGTVGPSGGKVSALHFAVVGDTRPATIDDTGNYPSMVASTIWNDVQAFSPRPLFAVSTGDYMFASTHNGQASPQLDLYLAARGGFSNVVFPALGNHECTGATASECGQGNPDGMTDNYKQFLAKMLMPLGQSLPYYAIEIDDVAGAWTSKFVFVAANAWNSAQATWLDAALAKPTTYTFVVRHESDTVTACPGVAPSLAIIEAHPYTLKIVGHTHTYEHFQKEKTVVVGNGGAPLASNINYGYGIFTQRADGVITFYMHDYTTNAIIDSWAVDKDGNAK